MIVTLTGGNGYSLKSELGRLVAEFTDEFTDMGLQRIDGQEVEFNDIRESLQSLPFLASKKLVVLRAPSANKEFLENAEKLFDDISETTDVVIVEPRLDKRSTYYKYLKKNTDLKEFNELDEYGLAKWLTEYAGQLKGTLNAGDAKYLVERVGANQEMLSHELEKLVTYDPHITVKNIDLLTEANSKSTIFQLLDYGFSGNKNKVLEIYADLRSASVEPQQIVAMLAWQLHVLVVISSSGDRSDSVISKDSKINPYVLSKSRNIVRKLSKEHLKNLVGDLLELDKRLKTTAINSDDALQNFLLNI